MGEKRVNDNVFTNGDGGIPLLAVQISASANALSSEGKYAPLQVDSNGALKIAGSLSTTPVSNQTVNITQVGGNTAATAAAGTLSVGITGTPNVNVAQIGGNTLATGAAGVQSVDIRTIGAVTPATAATGVLSIDMGRVSGGVTVTASAGVQRVHSLGSIDVSTIYASGLGKVPQFAVISASAQGTADVIASAASTSYIILAYNLMSNNAVTAQFFSNSIVMSGKIPMVTGGVGKVCPFSPVGWMSASAGNNVKINLSANAEVTGEIVYIAV